MTKIITTIIVLLMLIACGKQSDRQDGVNAADGKELCEKIARGEQFTQADYAKAIALLKYDIDSQSAALNRDADPDAATMDYLAFSASQEYTELAAKVEKLSAYIYSHRNDLDETNQKALSEVEQAAVEFARDLQQIVSAK